MPKNRLARFFIHTVTVTPFLGTDKGTGADLFGPPVTVAGMLQGSTRLVQSVDGSELVSTGTAFYTSLADAVHFPLGSRVTLSNRVAEVMDVNTNDGGTLGLPDHTVVSLT